MIGGNLQIMITTMASVSGPLQGKQIRPVAVTSPKRSRFTPELPALSDAVPGFDVESWWGVYAPPKMPKPLVDRLNGEIRQIADSAEMRRELFPLSVKLSRLPNVELAHGTHPGARLDDGAALLEQIRVRFTLARNHSGPPREPQ